MGDSDRPDTQVSPADVEPLVLKKGDIIVGIISNDLRDAVANILSSHPRIDEFTAAMNDTTLNDAEPAEARRTIQTLADTRYALKKEERRIITEEIHEDFLETLRNISGRLGDGSDYVPSSDAIRNYATLKPHQKNSLTTASQRVFGEDIFATEGDARVSGLIEAIDQYAKVSNIVEHFTAEVKILEQSRGWNR
ncbi:MAG: hypothetical protein ACOYJ2_02585 [Rickettsiales bacterium]